MSESERIVGQILHERVRQVEKEGWSIEHDDNHELGQLALAASCYAAYPRILFYNRRFGPIWPWNEGFDKLKEHSYRRRLVMAAALLVAEIERVDRATVKENEKGATAAERVRNIQNGQEGAAMYYEKTFEGHDLNHLQICNGVLGAVTCSHITDVSAELVDLSRKVGRPLEIDFNDIVISASLESTPDDVVKAYNKLMNHHNREKAIMETRLEQFNVAAEGLSFKRDGQVRLIKLREVFRLMRNLIEGHEPDHSQPPMWFYNDCVGCLIRRGWKLTDDYYGLHRRGYFIHVKSIESIVRLVANVGGKESIADMLEIEFSERTDIPDNGQQD